MASSNRAEQQGRGLCKQEGQDASEKGECKLGREDCFGNGRCIVGDDGSVKAEGRTCRGLYWEWQWQGK